MKKNKGITLIALIITIVVMLILVAVSVNVIVNSNLIGYAEKTGDAYKNAIAEEEGYNPTLENGKTLEDYMKKAKIVEEIHNWVRTGDNLTCKCNQCTENGTKPEGRTLTIGQELDYKNTGKETSSISVEKAGGSTEITESMLNSGIKVASLKTNMPLRIAASINPQPTETQTIKKDADTKWVVLGAKDVNENGTNETLLLTTLNPTETIKLYGAAAYNNGPEEINRMCKELYGKDAEGMTMEDVNNCLGYTTNPKGMYNDESGNIQTVNNITTKLSRLKIWKDIKDNHQTPDGKNTEKALGEYPLNGYGYYLSDDGTYLVNTTNEADKSNTITTRTKNVIFGSNKEHLYWLASRGVVASAEDGYASFGLGSVNGGIAASYGEYFYSEGNENGGEFGLRAVVSLTSEIPAVVADSGSEQS